MYNYQNPALPCAERVQSLLEMMTLREKAGQINQRLFGWNVYETRGTEIVLTDHFKNEVAKYGSIGFIYGLFRNDPWSGVGTHNCVAYEKSPWLANEVQRYIIDNTKLKIPVLLGEECSHGHQSVDATLFPVNAAMASAFNPKLYEQTSAVAAAEIRARGAHIAFTSCLDMMLDPRWGRSEECFSEDPALTAKYVYSAVTGMQGKSIEPLENTKALALLKHFCAQGAAIGGHNSYASPIGERELREIHLPGMIAGTKAGARMIMAAYNEIDGIPCCVNKKLLGGILRQEIGFDGVVMADGGAVDRLNDLTSDAELSAAMSIEAGMDVSLWDDACTHIEEAVNHNKLSMESVDAAVKNILTLKFSSGLFDHPYIDESIVIHTIKSKSSRELSIRAAAECAVLLKNDGVLPLRDEPRKIAVIGPNADQIYNQIGDYSAEQRREECYTLANGIRQVFTGAQIKVEQGSNILSDIPNGIEKSVALAEWADIVILAVGSSSARNFDMAFDSNGAALVAENSFDMDCGEGVDIADISLSPAQNKLVDAVYKANQSLISVVITGRPLALADLNEKSRALLFTFYNGPLGGLALAELIAGKTSPSGKLPVTLPLSPLSIPIHYNEKNHGGGLDYADLAHRPLYPFGFGLSYSTFELSPPQLSADTVSSGEIEAGTQIKVRCSAKNTGSMAAFVTPQLYIKVINSTVYKRKLELKDFQKVLLQPGECAEITFKLGKEELSEYDINTVYRVVKGQVMILTGTDSEDLKGETLKVI